MQTKLTQTQLILNLISSPAKLLAPKPRQPNEGRHWPDTTPRLQRSASTTVPLFVGYLRGTPSPESGTNAFVGAGNACDIMSLLSHCRLFNCVT